MQSWGQGVEGRGSLSADLCLVDQNPGRQVLSISARSAMEAADARFSTPSLAKIRSRCLFTVRWLISKISLISRFDLPCAIHTNTSASREVKAKAAQRISS